MNTAALAAPRRAASGPAAGKTLSLLLTFAMHLLLALFLFYGVRWQVQAPEPVQVELVRALPAESAVPPKVTLPPEPAPQPPPPVVAPEPKPLPPPPKADIVQKEKPKPPKPAPKAEDKPPPRPDPFKDQLRQELKNLDHQRAIDAAARDLANERAAQAANAEQKALAAWLARIRDKVRGNIVLPPGLQGNPEALFFVSQLPTGEILDVRLRKSSGNAALDAAIERALRKSSPLPKPQPTDLFSRELEITFRPLDN